MLIILLKQKGKGEGEKMKSQDDKVTEGYAMFLQIHPGTIKEKTLET
jgi:hypothetical protein